MAGPASREGINFPKILAFMAHDKMTLDIHCYWNWVIYYKLLFRLSFVGWCLIHQSHLHIKCIVDSSTECYLSWLWTVWLFIKKEIHVFTLMFKSRVVLLSNVNDMVIIQEPCDMLRASDCDNLDVFLNNFILIWYILFSYFSLK